MISGLLVCDVSGRFVSSISRFCRVRWDFVMGKFFGVW